MAKPNQIEHVIKDMSRAGPINMLACTKCNFTIVYTGHDHELPCHNCQADTEGMPRMYDFS